MTIREELECDGCDRREYELQARSWARMRIDIRDFKTPGSETSYLLDVCPTCQARPVSELLIRVDQKREKEAPRYAGRKVSRG